ncbi:shikimate dehydrogenase [Pontibacillus sp. ALD_SL1]|uniref:shikimate dehydrogenase n=1 Tax=Pontibacillus sp. ALD_SL1 TaxID=2777185 RepID=UPI001A967598|nr:shikimate dehydrogenase [Pontibacillus sp. ALD_SL1]QSS99031.1 shikimate dehydrogenase [Pontibacillus sp. ALD_SL1]
MGYLFGLVGYPAKHSKSPWIHEQFLKKQGEQGAYRIFETSPDVLKDKLQALKMVEVDGFNVTVPYKEEIIPYLDEVDSYASSVGAVNTVHVQDGKWIGYNTDGKGYVRSLVEEYPDTNLNKTRVLILGAGGAARGIYRALAEAGAPVIDIANRTASRGEALRKLRCESTESSVLSLEKAEEGLSNYDLIVQTTSVGMTPDESGQIISLRNVKHNAIVSDIVYKPFETSILKEAKNRGARVLNGHGMLIYQAALAFEQWTETFVEANDIVTKFEQQLKGDTTC